MEIFLKIVEILKDLGPIIIALVAICLTYRHHKHSKQIADDRMMKELFTEFNNRYDELNGYLEKMSKYESMEYVMDEQPLEYPLLRDKLNDYFNLCAEEYYWYKNNRIGEDLWKSWEVGMNAWYDSHAIIREAWREEYESFGYESFYLKKNEQFFKNFVK